MGMWTWDYRHYCKVCEKETDWKGWNDNDDEGDHLDCMECAEI